VTEPRPEPPTGPFRPTSASPIDLQATETLFRLGFVPGWIAVTVTTILFAAGVSVPLSYQLLPLAVSVVVLGLPHGAIDHLAIPRTRGDPVTVRWLAAVGVLYLVVGGVYAAVWFLSPAVAVVVFILLTWAHWGQGDIYPLVALVDGDHPAGRFGRLLTAATRGSLPMAVPFVAFPEQYELVVTTLARLFDPSAPAALSAVFTPTARLAVAALVAALVCSSLAVGALMTTDRRAVAFDAAETGLLVAFFSTVPPILAIGLYFCLWHALRHIVRLLAVDPGAQRALVDRRYGAALSSFAWDAAPLTAVSIGLLGLLYLVVPGTIAQPLDLLGTYLVLIAVLTLPHVVVVSVMDHEQRLWTPS